ncbi:glycosyltransferase family 4 protein [Thermococcus gammatolerans]|uniref:glycosyltransferase family 4 protein n=1 Tax=Thermococcus gammatolerans TaxID=187878 RepID=UPI00066284EC|nr:glycosyltransferase family 4 protein [Thermococcus gammatolerans]
MRILIVSPYFPPEGGGLESYAIAMVEELSKEHEVRVICMSRFGSSKETLRVQGKAVPLERVKGFVLSNTPLSLRFTLRLFSIVKNWRPDLIIAHTPVPFAADVAALASALFGVPLIIVYHTLGLRKGALLDVIASIYSKTLERFTLSRAALLVAVSPSVRNYLRETGFRSVVVPPRPKLELLSAAQKKLPPKEKIVLFIGQLSSFHRFKNFELLLRAFAQASRDHPDWELWVVGGGDELPKYRTLARELGLSKRVRFFGPVSDAKKLAEIYSRASIVVLPSSFESFGLVVIEGAIFGAIPLVSGAVAKNIFPLYPGVGKASYVLRQKAELSSMLSELFGHPKTLKKLSAMLRETEGSRKSFKRFRYISVLLELNLLEKF